MANIPCPDCKGKRLKSESLAVTVGGMNIAQLSDMTVRHAREKLSTLTLNKTEEMIAGRILKEIDSRLGFLISVGLDYLTLSRAAGTLSGGEQQRVAIARSILAKPHIIFADEPTGNLDKKAGEDTLNLLSSCAARFGQTLIIVTHDLEIAKKADRIIKIEDGKIVSNQL